MATFSSVTRRHILQAIEEYDARGGDDFLALYGFGPSTGYWLVHEGRSYDSTAVLGVAHRYATGRLATSEEFHGGLGGAADLLRRRGFDVTEPSGRVPQADRRAATAGGRAAGKAASPRTTSRRTTTRTATARRAASEESAVLCPMCHMALPATGICDTCG